MDALFEAIIELIVEGGMQIGMNKKYSRWIRYPLLLFAVITCVGLIALFVFMGFDVLKYGLWRAIFFWVMGFVFAIGIVWNFHDEYKRYQKKKSKLK